VSLGWISVGGVTPNQILLCNDSFGAWSTRVLDFAKWVEHMQGTVEKKGDGDRRDGKSRGVVRLGGCRADYRYYSSITYFSSEVLFDIIPLRLSEVSRHLSSKESFMARTDGARDGVREPGKTSSRGLTFYIWREISPQPNADGRELDRSAKDGNQAGDLNLATIPKISRLWLCCEVRTPSRRYQ
jgi:hypothetical protein